MSARSALERVTKWRNLFSGWQLGTRPKGDSECDAVRDHRELSIVLRVENSALIGLLIEKGVIKPQEWEAAVEREANLLNLDYEQRFPGVQATERGLAIDAEKVAEAGWMRNWKP